MCTVGVVRLDEVERVGGESLHGSQESFMVRQLAYTLLVLFAVFSFTTATNSGELANSFIDWLDDGLETARTFVNSALGHDPGVDSAPAVAASTGAD